MIIFELPVEWRARALVLAAPDDVRMWLTAEELLESEKVRVPRKRDEWVDSRVAAKMLAVLRGHGSDPHRMTVARPHPILENGDRRFVSLSHSSPFVAAAIDDRPIGIDVEMIRDIDERAAHLFLQDDEFTTLKQLPLSVECEIPGGLRFDQVETFASEDVVVALTR